MDAGYEFAEKELAKLERALAKEYATAEREMQKKLDKHLAKFAADDEKKLKQLAEKRITAVDYERWYRNQVLRADWMRDLIDSFTAEQIACNQRACDIINDSLPEVYAENFNYGTYAVEKGIGMSTGFRLYNKDMIVRLVKDNPQLLPKAAINIPKDRRWNKRKLRSALIQSLLQGESIPERAKRLQKAGMISHTIDDIKNKERKTVKQINRELNRKNKIAAVRNARTMTTGAQNAGKLDSYRRAAGMGVALVKLWDAIMDNRTRDSHALLDGETQELEDEFSNGLMYPGDESGDPAEVYNCRCNLSMELEGFKRDRAKIFENNAEHYGYESYEEWKDAHRRS